jgi:VanZ family protein
MDPRLSKISVGIMAAIIYASLFPFDFVFDVPSMDGPFRALIATWHGSASRGDLIANTLFYFPFGYFVARSLRRFSGFLRVLLVVVVGVVLSVSMELAQFYLPERFTSMIDVYANGAGTLLGAVAAGMLREKTIFSQVRNVAWHPFVVLLIASWLGYRLFPFVPVIDLHKYWKAVQPLVRSPKLLPLDVYRHSVIWLSIGLMVEYIFGTARSHICIMLLVPAVLFARILIFDKLLSPAEVVGGVIGALFWFAVVSRARIRAPLIAALFTTVVVVQALQPFQVGTPTHPFGWVPFLSLIDASPELGVLSLLEKVFMYGSLIWLAVRAGFSLMVAAAFGSVLVLALEFTKLFLPGRSAEITDVIILVALAAAMKLMNEGTSRDEA